MVIIQLTRSSSRCHAAVVASVCIRTRMRGTLLTEQKRKKRLRARSLYKTSTVCSSHMSGKYPFSSGKKRILLVSISPFFLDNDRLPSSRNHLSPVPRLHLSHVVDRDRQSRPPSSSTPVERPFKAASSQCDRNSTVGQERTR